MNDSSTLTKRPWVSGRELADLLGIAENTTRTWRKRGMGPPSQRLGGRVVYYLDDLDRWLAAGKRTPARPHGGAA